MEKVFYNLLYYMYTGGTLLESVIGYYQEDNLTISNTDQIWPCKNIYVSLCVWAKAITYSFYFY